MAITLQRQLNDADKQQILKVHRRICFATGHEIPNEEPVQFDHIRAFAAGGLSELDNIAPMCQVHNSEKGALPLEDFRVKLRLNDFFSQGDDLTLKHLLLYLKKRGDIKDFGQPLSISSVDGKVRLESGSTTYSADLHKCPITGWPYFYVTLPVALLDSDDTTDLKLGMQPRFLIPDKVFNIYRHFQRHPVLQPSIGRIDQNKILLFDGQHKIAGLLWNGRQDFECKVYIKPELRLLNDTNILAHDTFSQTRFYASIMVLKLGSEFGADFDRYKNMDDGSSKSEAGFMNFLAHDPAQPTTSGERNRKFRSYLYNAVLQDEDNKAARFVSNSNRSTDEKPITIDMLSKSLFADLLYTKPTEDNLATEVYKRDSEIQNNVWLMNTIYDLALSGWNPKAGPADSHQRKLGRIFRSRAMMAWSELLRDAICAKLELFDSDEKARPLYRHFGPEEQTRVKKIVERLMGWKFWNSPDGEIDRVMADNASIVKNWMKDHGLTTGYLMGAPE